MAKLRNTETIYSCQKHLGGEWLEQSYVWSRLDKKHRIDGMIRNNLIEPKNLRKRYDELKAEMLRRGYHPKMEYRETDISYLPIKYQNYVQDYKRCLEDLLRCPKCKERYEKYKELNVAKNVGGI